MNATRAFMNGVGDAPMMSGTADLDLLNSLLGSAGPQGPTEEEHITEEKWREHSHKPAIKNDPSDPNNPNEVRERSLRKLSESQ